MENETFKKIIKEAKAIVNDEAKSDYYKFAKLQYLVNVKYKVKS